ncbi:MAG: MotA/TolQ/ExbB proton channel family protein [Bacteroidales bacterium]|nr:MotA/TolQ/ExbB proton channel family protein [Porphyromonas sp.]MDD6934986.1 MotA/TolQ/ExbB proton channel family protein [Bacteroidales bacterium]MDY3103001.1 MotA/TolQ/ExbB proton channel family protein [Porphyromonas sp.]
MHYLSNAMFWVSNGLLVPVVVALLYLFIRSLFMLGTLFGTWQTYRKRQGAYSKVIGKEHLFEITMLQKVLEKQQKSPFDHLLRELLQSDRVRRDLLIGEYDLTMERRLGAAKILTKFGPILGLMGTLIPMGPALVGLSSGDIAGMAYNMQVAFATTVIGMFASAVGYIALHVLRNYHYHDLIWLDYVNEKLGE